MRPPFVPVLGALPVGWLPSPVSLGTITPRLDDGAGGGSAPSGDSDDDAGERAVGPLDCEGPHPSTAPTTAMTM